MITRRTAFSAPIVLGLLLSGCNRYAFSINDNEVYRPPPLYQDFRIADSALDTCIRQTIADQRVTAPGQLTTLRCSHAGIRSLEGIEHFAALTKLDLSHNDIRSGEPLTQLEKLTYVEIEGNPRLSCADIIRDKIGQALEYCGQ